MQIYLQYIQFTYIYIYIKASEYYISQRVSLKNIAVVIVELLDRRVRRNDGNLFWLQSAKQVHVWRHTSFFIKMKIATQLFICLQRCDVADTPPLWDSSGQKHTQSFSFVIINTAHNVFWFRSGINELWWHAQLSRQSYDGSSGFGVGLYKELMWSTPSIIHTVFFFLPLFVRRCFLCSSERTSWAQFSLVFTWMKDRVLPMLW